MAGLGITRRRMPAAPCSSTPAAAALDRARLAHFMVAELKVLWLADSTTLLMLALTTGYAALRRKPASGPLFFLVAAVPAATAVLLYTYLGRFYAAHMLLAASVMVAAAGLVAHRRPADA